MRGYYLCVMAIAGLIATRSMARSFHADKVRRVQPKSDEITEVRTAVGIATLIQVPDRPTSVVLGDSNAFKVEYLENALTIKPLARDSKSNLYVYTEARRFNVSLVTVPLSSADYVVYLDPPRPVPVVLQEERWHPYRVEKTTKDFSVRFTRAGVSADIVVAEFVITAANPASIKPDWIWVTQGEKTVPIQQLYLSGVMASEQSPIHGSLAIRLSDLSENGLRPKLEIRAQHPMRISLPEVTAWKK